MSTFTYYPNLPNPPDYPGDDAPGMQTNAGSIAGIIAQDHVAFNTSGGGNMFNRPIFRIPVIQRLVAPISLYMERLLQVLRNSL